ncbi:putative immunity protein [Streptomyces sp. NPDC056773]|uniref:putative immunity protein n=1 Tax=unclassified Streptomyces TaxID=2593676 RepID=UPI0036B2A579
MILPKIQDPRFVTIRRGGTLTDADHHLLALWAASCAEHVLGLFEAVRPEDPRPREAIEHARAWVRGEVTMTQSRAAGGHAMGAARDLRGAAAYAIKAARAAAPDGGGEAAGRRECRWQREQLPEPIRELVLDDQRLRNPICWWAFDC